MEDQEKIKKVVDIYDKRAKNSDSVDAAGQWGTKDQVPIICEEIIKKIGIKDDDKILEVGCGSCVLGNVVKERCQFYVGIDVSLFMLKRGYEDSAGSRKLNLIQGEANKIPIKENSFSIIIMNSVTMYFPSNKFLRKVLTEIERVACHNAILFIGENTNPSDYYTELVWFQELSQIGKFFAKPYIRMRKWLAGVNPKLAGKWDIHLRELSPKFIEKYFQGRGEVIVSDAPTYTVRRRIYGENGKGSRRIDILIRLKQSK